MLGSSMGMEMAPGPNPDVWRGLSKFTTTNFTIPDNSCSMKYALESVPGLVDVGVLHGDTPGPHPDVWRG